ncbi:MAG: hypothetical protein Q4Q06_06205 [Bacteroidota bacterium]|nr:hypothetical protein [Bacteroidota bacterium]
MKRIFLTLTLLVSMTSLIFVACNDKEEQSQIPQKSTIQGNKVPDGTYIGYYNFDGAKKIEIKQTIKDNEVVLRWINGEQQPLNYAPKTVGRFWHEGNNKSAENKAIDCALEYSKTYPCVSIVIFPYIEDESVLIYQVDVDSNTPCDYEKYL